MLRYFSLTPTFIIEPKYVKIIALLHNSVMILLFKEGTNEKKGSGVLPSKYKRRASTV